MKNTNIKKQQLQGEGQNSSKQSQSSSQRESNLNSLQTTKQNSERASIVQQPSHNLKAQYNNTNNLGSSNSGASLKSFQPILKAKDETQPKNYGGPQLKKQGSGPLDKKLKAGGANQVSMKEQPFNYEEKSASKKSSDQSQASNVQLQRKSSPFQIQDAARFGKQREDEMIEVRQDFATSAFHNDSKLEDRIRPSDEVQYQELNLKDEKEQTGTSNFSKRTDANRDIRGTQSSFKVVEENKSEMKDYRVVEHDYQNNENFEVIKEDHQRESFYVREQDGRNNSDFKRFNIDDDVANLQSLRLANVRNLQNVNLYPAIKYADYSYYDNEDQLQDTPKTIKDKTRNYTEYQNLIEEKSLKGTNEFIGSTNTEGIISPQSFGSPAKIQNPQQNQKYEYNQNQAHILSFSDKNQMYDFQQPPLQTIEAHLNNDLPVLKQEGRSISPSALLQQKRLSDIMNISKGGEMGSSEQKIDEKALNNMIDLEKNYVIMQYESILQQLNIEFHKLLQKTKETDEQVAAKEQLIAAQSQIIQDKEQSQFQLDQINRQLSTQIQELLQELDFLTLQCQKQLNFNENTDAWRFERDILDEKIETLQSKVSLHEQNESDLKDQLEICQQKHRQSEQKFRLKEEEMFQVARDNQAAQRDLKNIKDIEQTLKQEIQMIQGQRVQLEDALQDSKQKICNFQIQLRQKDNEIESAVRENRSIKGTLDALQMNFQEVLDENNAIKDMITDGQKDIIQLRNHIDRQGRDMRNMQTEMKKQQMLLEQERLSSQNMEEHYKSEIQKLMNSIRDQQLNFKKQELTVYNPDENKGKFIINEEKQQQYKPPQQFNNTLTYRDNYDMQKPLQEQNANYYSPQRNTRNQIQYQQQFQDKQPQVQQQPLLENASKNTIAWPGLWGGNLQKQQQQQAAPLQSVTDIEKYQQQVPQRNEDSNGKPRRKTLINQNESQLRDVLSWDQSSNSAIPFQQYPPPKVQRSLERVVQNSNSEKQIYNFLNQPAAVEARPRIENSSNWQQMRSPGNQQKQQDLEIQAAGKKSTTQQSPFRGKNGEQQINHLQNSLSALQIDKEKVENEYRKIGAPKNKLQIEKKQELEFEIEIVNKNIQNIKQKLREMNAL